MGRRVAGAISAAAFVYVLLRPVSNTAVLVAVFALLSVLALGAIVANHRRLAREFRPLILMQVLFAGLGLVVGVANHNPGLVEGAVVFVVAPITFWVLATAADEDLIALLLKWAAVGTILLAVAIVLYAGSQQGLLPSLLPSSLLTQLGAGYSTRFASPSVRLYGLSTLVAAGPLWIAAVLAPRGGLLPRRMLCLAAAGSATVAGLLAGRRIVGLLLLLTPLLLWVATRIVRAPRYGLSLRQRRARAVAALAVVVVLLALPVTRTLFSPTTVLNNSVDAVAAVAPFQGSGQLADVRTQEASELIAYWEDSPIIGHGFGTLVPGYRRNATSPWQFELQYHLLLVETGVVGAILFALAVLFAAMALRRAGMWAPEFAWSLAVVTVGAMALLIANAGDPYLRAPAHMWALYLPLAVGNTALRSARAAALGSQPS